VASTMRPTTMKNPRCARVQISTMCRGEANTWSLYVVMVQCFGDCAHITWGCFVACSVRMLHSALRPPPMLLPALEAWLGILVNAQHWSCCMPAGHCGMPYCAHGQRSIAGRRERRRAAPSGAAAPPAAAGGRRRPAGPAHALARPPAGQPPPAGHPADVRTTPQNCHDTPILALRNTSFRACHFCSLAGTLALCVRVSGRVRPRLRLSSGVAVTRLELARELSVRLLRHHSGGVHALLVARTTMRLRTHGWGPHGATVCSASGHDLSVVTWDHAWSDGVGIACLGPHVELWLQLPPTESGPQNTPWLSSTTVGCQ
jgi:hypothetical protein